MRQVLNFAERKHFYEENSQLLGFIFSNFIKIYNLEFSVVKKKKKKKELCVADSLE